MTEVTNMVKFNDKIMEVPIDSLIDNDGMNFVENNNPVMKSVVQNLPPVNKMQVNTMPKSILKSVSPTIQQNSGIKNNQLVQTVQNQPLKQMAQLVQQNQVQNNTTGVEQVGENNGFNLLGLKISKSTLFVLAFVVILIVGGYFYFKSVKKVDNKNKKKRVKEVSYQEQKKLESKNKEKDEDENEEEEDDE
jgi:hypothetical protein